MCARKWQDVDSATALSNRDKKRAPRLGIFWCWCDLNMVWNGSKCSVCHRRMLKTRRNKK